MSATVGTRGTEYEMVVERGKIQEFAAAMQSANPAYRGPDAIVPPTFLASSVLWAPEGARLGHGFDRKRLLHGEQEFVFHGPPPRAGQVLKVVDRIDQRYEKPGKRGGKMRFVVIVTEFRAEDGTLVAESRSTMIETAPKPDAS
ncbi:MAG TPA: MaoC family dehydratase N-terminal domain-containing protein [Amycolatopsis sp.]|nr:MaoC family dehydratase N-terminal domain-containing protein [Amycolatopsis sp.]